MNNTPQKRSKFMEKIMDSITDTLLYLHQRWQDEKGYEDFKDYKSRIIDELTPLGVSVLSITETFRITIQAPGFPYNPIIYITKSDIGWKSNYQIPIVVARRGRAHTYFQVQKIMVWRYWDDTMVWLKLMHPDLKHEKEDAEESEDLWYALVEDEYHGEIKVAWNPEEHRFEYYDGYLSTF